MWQWHSFRALAIRYWNPGLRRIAPYPGLEQFRPSGAGEPSAKKKQDSQPEKATTILLDFFS